MQSSNNEGCAKNPIVVLLGVLTAIIAIFAFVTGYQSLPQMFRPNTTSMGTGNVPAPQATAPVAYIPPTSAPPTSVPARPPVPEPTAIPTAIPYPSTVFEDDFGGVAPDTSSWSLDNLSNNSVSVSGGSLRFSSSSDRSPYIYSRTNPFPTTGDFRFTIRYRYSRIDVCGAYISLTTTFLPSFVQPQGFRWTPIEGTSQLTFFIWHEVIWYDTQSRRQNIPVLGDYTSTHEMTINYQNSQYRVLQEGTPIFTSDTTFARLRYIAFGNAAIQAGNCSWDSLEIDSIRVERLP